MSYRLSTDAPSPGLETGTDFEVSFTLVLAEMDDDFAATGTVVQVRLPDNFEIVGYTSDGPFDPNTGKWTAAPSSVTPSVLQLTLCAATSGAFRITGEVADAVWPDTDAVFGDGRGEDFAVMELQVVDVVVGSPDPIATRAELGSVLGIVFDDHDGDGVMDDDEPPVPEVTLTLEPTVGASLEATTDSAGGFSFEGLPIGSYRLTFDAGAKVVTTPDHLIGLTEGASVSVAVGVGERSALWWPYAVVAVLIAGLAFAGGTYYGGRRAAAGDTDESVESGELVSV